MTDIDDDDFEERFEEFCGMTPAEQDAELEREMAAYNRWWDSLTPLEQYRVSRGAAVEACLTFRTLIREGLCVEMFTGYLRSRQKRLLRLRIERATGIRPGTA